MSAEANTGAVQERTDKPGGTQADRSNTCYPEEVLTGGTQRLDSISEYRQ